MTEFSVSDEFEAVSHLQNVNQKLAYLYKEVLGKIFVKYGDLTYGPYQSAIFLERFNEGIVYCAQENGKWSVMVDGKKQSQDFSDIYSPIKEFKGKPLFFAQTNEGRFLYNGEERLAQGIHEGCFCWGTRREGEKTGLRSGRSEDRIAQSGQKHFLFTPIAQGR